MLNFCFANDGTFLGVSESIPENKAGQFFTNRNDMRSFEEACELAKMASAAGDKTYIPVDEGDGVYPRFDVVEVPKVGDEVSMAFNGDYYPRGTVVKVSADHRIVTTSDGARFFRRRKTGSWRYQRMWYLVDGHVRKWNPEL